MSVVSLKFVLIVLGSLGLFYLINPRYRSVFLALLSVLFIATYTYTGLVYVVIFSLFNYCFGLLLSRNKSVKAVFRTGIAVNILQLILLRYASFAIDPFIHLLNNDINFTRIAEVIGPLGISYFTLQGIGYLINVKMGWEKSERNFVDFLLYIIYFPKFLSGPVERSNHFLPQIKAPLTFDPSQVTEGMKLALIGFFKKVAIANQLAPYALSVYDFEHAGGSISWILFIIQPLYLYFDFSGYTDIALGVSKMFGINLLPNFQRPFFAENVSTFWKRFHMSLSSWFNDYIFRQVSFRYRKWGVYASVYAVFITWILFGIWHGAGWNFMLIGFLQALAIIYEFFTKKIRSKLFSNIPSVISVWFGRMVTYLFYCLSLVFFFTPDVKSGIGFLNNLAAMSGPSPFNDISVKPFQVLIYIPLVLFLELLKNDYPETGRRLERIWFADNRYGRLLRWSFYSLMITIIYISGFKSQQFVYANF
ncbi:MAG: Peptidoglycan O-acetyltransferase [Bacteroidetes bacterium ADurb.Bin145]|nr:MAG: Peptidoglycan O-acetyltransferase [Bacteroidetes bacterium ADurb.Bin145]